MNLYILKILTCQICFSHIFGMKNGIKMIFVSKGFLIPVEYFDRQITIWFPDDISRIFSCWVTYGLRKNFSIFSVSFLHGLKGKFVEYSTYYMKESKQLIMSFNPRHPKGGLLQPPCDFSRTTSLGNRRLPHGYM